MPITIASVTVDCADARTVARLVGLGATRVRDMEEYGYTWIVMTDPEGNEFCIAKAV